MVKIGNPLFSIIIPIYNVEIYLRQCVDSILNQTFRDIEVILVNDGSTDNSHRICDEYMQCDSRVRVIHKDNGGSSDARNFGVELAAGEYLMFVDSDDWWNGNECLIKIAKILENNKSIDILEFEMTRYYKNKSVKTMIYNDYMNTLEPEESLFYNVKNDLISISPCSKAIRRNFIIENELLFVKGIKSEDTEWYLRIMLLKPKCYFLTEEIYIYRKREGSITNSIDYKHLIQYYNILARYIRIDTGNQRLNYCIYSYIAYHFIILCGLTFHCIRSEKKQLISQIKDLRYVLKFDLHPKVKITNRFIRLIGFSATVFLLNKYIKFLK